MSGGPVHVSIRKKRKAHGSTRWENDYTTWYVRNTNVYARSDISDGEDDCA